MSVEGELTGVDNAVTLNYRYLVDGVSAMTSDKVIIKMIDAVNPCLVVPFQKPAEQYLYIVMPIRQ